MGTHSHPVHMLAGIIDCMKLASPVATAMTPNRTPCTPNAPQMNPSTVKAHIQFFDIFLAPRYAAQCGDGRRSKGEYDEGRLSEQNNADSAVETVGGRGGGGSIHVVRIAQL